MKKNVFAFLSILFFNLCYAQITTLSENFDAATCTGNSAFNNGCVPPWVAAGGTPSIFNSGGGNNTAWMWSYNSLGEAISINHCFMQGITYTLSFQISTGDAGSNDPNIAQNGTVNFIATNNPGAVTATPIGDAIFQNNIGAYLNTPTGVSVNYTPTQDFNSLWIFPFWNGAPGGGQAEMTVDSILITMPNLNPCFTLVDTICDNQPIIPDLNCTIQNMTDYRWVIHEIDLSGNWSQVCASNYINGNVQTLDFRTLCPGVFQAGKKYAIVLEVVNSCGNVNVTDSTFREVYIDSCDQMIDECTEIISGESVYQKRIFTGQVNNMKTIATRISGGKIYSIHQNLDIVSGVKKNAMILTVKNLDNGSTIAAWEYDFGMNVFSKDLFIIDSQTGGSGIYVLANTSPTPGDADNSRWSPWISGLLMKIDFSGNVVWLKQKEVPVSGITADQIPDNIFFNSFSPYIVNNNLEGWILVGSVRLRVSTHFRMLPALVRTDTNGNDLYKKYLEFDIPCPNCTENAKQIESNWAIDISQQTNGLNKYAVLLESRDNFIGIVGHTVNDIRMSYILLDENLNINQGYSGLVRWWSSNAGVSNPLNPRKIQYDGNSIKIVGQYLNYDKGFIAEFSSPYTFNAASSSEITEPNGLVDVTFYNSNYYALGRHRVFEFDASLNYVKSSNNFDSPIFNPTDFWKNNNYIGNLINIPNTINGQVPLSGSTGLVINDLNSQTYRKLNNNLDQTCDLETSPPQIVQLQLIESDFPHVEEGLTIEDPVIQYPSVDDLTFDASCCKNGIQMFGLIDDTQNTLDKEANELTPLSIENDEDSKFNLKLFPNPTSQSFMIKNEGKVDTYDQVKVYNLEGKLLLQLNQFSIRNSIDMTSFSKGIYIIEVTVNNESQFKKLSFQ